MAVPNIRKIKCQHSFIGIRQHGSKVMQSMGSTEMRLSNAIEWGPVTFLTTDANKWTIKEPSATNDLNTGELVFYNGTITTLSSSAIYFVIGAVCVRKDVRRLVSKATQQQDTTNVFTIITVDCEYLRESKLVLPVLSKREKKVLLSITSYRRVRRCRVFCGKILISRAAEFKTPIPRDYRPSTKKANFIPRILLMYQLELL